MKDNWRSLMAMQYLVVCIFDFIIFPILLGWYSIYTHSTYQAWVSLTLQSGGLYHIAMGAICGVTSWAKSQERIKGSFQDQPPYQQPYVPPTPPPYRPKPMPIQQTDPER
jgi:hypothetical protein